MIKVCLGVIAGGSIRTQTVATLLELVKKCPEIEDFIIQQGPYIHWNRQTVVRLALIGGCTHLLFVDADMVFNSYALGQLLEHDKDIIGATYAIKDDSHTLVNLIQDGEKLRPMRFDEVPPEPFKCHTVGMGCTLIKMSVFHKIKPPYFSHTRTQKYGEEGEDVYFCNKARKAGFEIWQHPNVYTEHIGDYSYKLIGPGVSP